MNHKLSTIGLKEELMLCRRNRTGSLTILGRKIMWTWLDEVEMVLYARYKRRNYRVEGQLDHQYIVIEEVQK